MPEGQVLEFTHVTKHFNEVTAVSDFSARVEPGAVTAFLGPNGAGKTTTLRILLGQVRATSGTATIGGTAYAELRQPLRTIGAVLEETVYRPRRTAERQLTIAAKANGIPLARVGEVLSLVGLDGEGDSRIGGFSLGMRQRLSVAHALLGDPGALVFDEPANGLDPEGIRWMRLLMRRLADEGRTVLVSSHVLSEVEQVADNVLVLSKGQLVLASGIETLADPKGGGSVIVDAADRGALTAALSAAGFDIEVLRSGLTVRGGDAGTVGAVAADAGIALSTLVQRGPTLEDVFIDLMRGGRLAPSAEPVAPQLAAPAPAEVTPTEPASTSEPASAPVESVVAIPVAAAAAWAAEAAAAPADEAVADDLATSVTGGEAAAEEAVVEDVIVEDVIVEDVIVDEEAPADEAPAADATEDGTDDGTDEEASAEADSTDAHASDSDAAPVDEAHAEGEQERDAQTDEAPAEETPARSFDEILFGSAAPAAADEATTPSDDDHAGVEDHAGDDDHAGVEVFADLNGTGASDTEDAVPDAEDAVPDAEEASENDPRSAAVSSMLAAAARAYYEDEPKDYPLTAEDQASEDGSTEESAHWTVASTGVIDTVPLAESAEAVSDEHSSDEHSSDEHSSDEHSADEQSSEEQSSDEHSSEEHTSEEESPEEHTSEEESSEGSVAADETDAENRDEHDDQTDGENHPDGENHHG
jgi:ABC-type multidrug transport system ATPase subunit